jgi:hypothetical protein
MPVFARALDRLLDGIWDVTEPLAGRCPVCAFWRGVLYGIVVGVLVML